MAYPHSEAVMSTGVRNPHSATMHLEGAPLDGDSYLLDMMDNRMMFMSHEAIVQVMQAHTGAGVSEHSDVKQRTVERVIGSASMITASAFDENGDRIAQFIKDQHKHVKGVDHNGVRYSAMGPKEWRDTHITFFNAPEQIFTRFDPRSKDPVQRQEILEQMYLEYITWYQRFGITDRYLAPNYDGYREQWQQMVDKLTLTESAQWGLDFIRNNMAPMPNIIPKLAQRAILPALKPPVYVYGKIIMSGLPEEVRSKYKKELPPYTEADALMVRGIEEAVKRVWPHLPGRARYPMENLEFLQRHGKYNGILDKLAVQAYKASAQVVAPTYRHIEGLVNPKSEDHSTYVGNIDFYPAR